MACSVNLLSASSLVDFRGPKSVVSVDYLTPVHLQIHQQLQFLCPQVPVHTIPQTRKHTNERDQKVIDCPDTIQLHATSSFIIIGGQTLVVALGNTDAAVILVDMADT